MLTAWPWKRFRGFHGHEECLLERHSKGLGTCGQHFQPEPNVFQHHQNLYKLYNILNSKWLSCSSPEQFQLGSLYEFSNLAQGSFNSLAHKSNPQFVKSFHDASPPIALHGISACVTPRAFSRGRHGENPEDRGTGRLTGHLARRRSLPKGLSFSKICIPIFFALVWAYLGLCLFLSLERTVGKLQTLHETRWGKAVVPKDQR